MSPSPMIRVANIHPSLSFDFDFAYGDFCHVEDFYFDVIYQSFTSLLIFKLWLETITIPHTQIIKKLFSYT